MEAAYGGTSLRLHYYVITTSLRLHYYFITPATATAANIIGSPERANLLVCYLKLTCNGRVPGAAHTAGRRESWRRQPISHRSGEASRVIARTFVYYSYHSCC